MLNTHMCLLYEDGRYLPAQTDGPGVWGNHDRERAYAKAREMRGLCVTLPPCPAREPVKAPAKTPNKSAQTADQTRKDLEEYEALIWGMAQ